jgi:hypothetical protein
VVHELIELQKMIMQMVVTKKLDNPECEDLKEAYRLCLCQVKFLKFNLNLEELFRRGKWAKTEAQVEYFRRLSEENLRMCEIAIKYAPRLVRVLPCPALSCLVLPSLLTGRGATGVQPLL